MAHGDTLRRIMRPLWQPPERRPVTLTVIAAVVWCLGWLDWSAWRMLGQWFDGLAFTAGVGAAGWWIVRTRTAPPVRRRLVGTITLPVVGQWSVFAAQALGLPALARLLVQLSILTLFLIGLAWTVWLVEMRSRALARDPVAGSDIVPSRFGAALPRRWNPFDLGAWFYRRRHPTLDQSLWTFLGYAVLFLLAFLVLTRLSGCREIYEMPSGAGIERQIEQTVQIRKVVRRKFVINPLSSVLFRPPPIDEIPLELQEITRHLYQVGQGTEGAAGFSAGTDFGKVRFIRLEYEGGDWDQDFGIGSDLNMLIEYGIRTGHRVHDRTESRRIAQLKNFPTRQSPPLVYITGQRTIIASDEEVEILRSYLVDSHGMLFADNGGSGGWHGQFFGLMNRVLPTVQPVRVPLDHPIHRLPYAIPFLPYVAPHGGKDAWGWVVNGRLVAYYHPGDIGDAWADGHAGVRREIWEYCYQLGTNIIFYAHAQYNRWLTSQESSAESPAPQ